MSATARLVAFTGSSCAAAPAGRAALGYVASIQVRNKRGENRVAAARNKSPFPI